MTQTTSERDTRQPRRVAAAPSVTLVLALTLGAFVGQARATDTICDGAPADAAGYRCIQPGFADMIPDVSGSGTNITSWKPSGCTGDDCYRLVGSIGGTFTWYGNAYSSLYISSNGYVSFAAGYTNDAGGASVPDPSPPNNAIYAYGDDLDPSSGGTVKYKNTACTVDRDGDGSNDPCFVVQWTHVPGIDGAAALTVTVQLALDFATNEALIEMEEEIGTDVALHPHLIGTENSAGSAGLWYKEGSDVDSSAAGYLGGHDQFLFYAGDSTAPGNVTKLTTASGDLTVAPEWVNPPDSDLSGVLVLAEQGTTVTGAPLNGTTYAVGDLIGTSQVVCVAPKPATTCTDNTVSNGSQYTYKASAYDSGHNYAGGVARAAFPRAAATYKWAYTSSATTLAPAGVLAGQYVVGIGNDRLLHRMNESNGKRGSGWVPPTLGGAVQSRPMVGDLNPGGPANDTAYLASQSGYLYRYSLDDGALLDAARNVIGDHGCPGGILQAGPVIMLSAYESPPRPNDNRVIVATRCGATDNAILVYDLDLFAVVDEYAGGVDGLGIANATPAILYRDSANNLVYVGVRDDGGESVVVFAIDGAGNIELPIYSEITGIGGIDASPELFRHGSDEFVAVGNTAGTVYVYDAINRTGGAGSPLVLRGSATSSDGPVKGVAVSTQIPLGGATYENWVVWSTDSQVHGVKVDAGGTVDGATRWDLALTSPSVPLVLRWVTGSGDTTAYVGSGDGRLYELDATTGAVKRSFLVEAGKTVGDPTFDYNTGTNQGIVVGTTGGTMHWVKIN